MSYEELTARVRAVIAATQHLPQEKITADSTFQELGIDSLDGINILFAVESEFNINIPGRRRPKSAFGSRCNRRHRETSGRSGKEIRRRSAPDMHASRGCHRPGCYLRARPQQRRILAGASSRTLRHRSASGRRSSAAAFLQWRRGSKFRALRSTSTKKKSACSIVSRNLE